ncbi:MAG: GUN4 domain-containing protein [Synechococcus sp. LacPavin_0920_WC12_MAG_50_7]|nr:GUN4 domain-containing protein [Synechococcus sp. LacPavin_0920_WC12_MAG_50_7]
MLTVPRPEELLEGFLTGNERQQLRFWPQLQAQAPQLQEFAWQKLLHQPRTANSWRLPAPVGASDLFAEIQDALLLEQLEIADRFTSSALREMAGVAAVTRGYVYYSEVAGFDPALLAHIDALWWLYSNGRFGFRIQQRLRQSSDGNWEKLWLTLGWKFDGVWTRYPNSFNWTHAAPEGHLPLVNQLRGVRLFDAILRHPALDTVTTSA